MHAISLLKKWFERNGVIGHRARLGALLRVVNALLSGGRLALTDLGRHRAGEAFVKHHIKAVDRLLGNHHVHAERQGVYRALARTLLQGLARPVIVDWADCELDRKLLILKAAVPIGGRAISVYEEVHPMRRYNSPKTHRRFLRELKAVLPEECCPIIVTDAGFRGPWFREVESYGWDWVGRIRNRIKYFRPDTGRWCYTHSLYREATPRVRHIGERCLSRRHRYWCRLYLVRAYRRRPGRPCKRRVHGSKHLVSKTPPRALAACNIAAAPAWHRRAGQADLRATNADRRDVPGSEESPMGIRTALRTNDEYQAARGVASCRRPCDLCSVVDGTGGEGAALGATLPGEH